MAKPGKYITQYFGPWAITGTAFSALRTRFNAIDDLDAHIALHASEVTPADPYADQPRYEVKDGTAFIPVTGEIVKYESSIFAGTSTVRLREAMRAAANDAAVQRIWLHIDSPGGTVSGVDDLARDIRKIRARKPVIAYCEDTCASAAYWIASQATQVVASPSAYVGSIGVYCVVVDSSKAAEAAGLQFTVVKSAAHKGELEDGIPVSGEALAETQRTIDDINNLFVNTVAAGRGVSPQEIQASATGQVWLANEAMRRGLIDAVEDADDVLALDFDKAPAVGAVTLGGHTMAEDKKAPESTEEEPNNKPATIGELEEALPDATSDQLVGYLKDEMTVDQAMEEFEKQRVEDMEEENAKLNSELASAKEQLKAKEDELAEVKSKPATLPGGPGIEDKPRAAQSKPAGDFKTLWQAYAKERGKSLFDTLGEAAEKYPAEHAAYIGNGTEKGGD